MYKSVLPAAFLVPFRAVLAGEGDSASQQLLAECASTIRAAIIVRNAPDEILGFIGNELLPSHFSIQSSQSSGSSTAGNQQQQPNRIDPLEVTNFLSRLSAAECDSNNQKLAKQVLRDFLVLLKRISAASSSSSSSTTPTSHHLTIMNGMNGLS